MTIVTLGVYGFNEAAFFQALQRAGVDTFCDLRRRRGVRGAQYAFANSTRLQQRLAQLGIRYLHLLDLAPSPELRRCQTEADRAGRVPARQRLVLAPAFIEGYQRERLACFGAHEFLRQLGSQAKTVALFCVERVPSACHRGLLAQRLQEQLGPKLQVLHLLPESAGP